MATMPETVAHRMERMKASPAVIVTASRVVAGFDKVTILSLYQSAVYNETKYQRLRLSCCNKLLTISQLPNSS